MSRARVRPFTRAEARRDQQKASIGGEMRWIQLSIARASRRKGKCILEQPISTKQLNMETGLHPVARPPPGNIIAPGTRLPRGSCRPSLCPARPDSEPASPQPPSPLSGGPKIRPQVPPSNRPSVHHGTPAPSYSRDAPSSPSPIGRYRRSKHGAGD